MKKNNFFSLEKKRFFSPPPGPAVSCSVSFHRNISGSKFPFKENAAVLEKLRDSVFCYLSRLKKFRDGYFLELDSTSQDEKNFLAERGYLPYDFSGGVGRGLAVSSDFAFRILLNFKDHLKLTCLLPGGSTEQAFSLASETEELLGGKFLYSYREKFGYLSSSPLQSGSGIEISLLLHLPALKLTGRLEKVFENLYAANFMVTGVYGEGSYALGDFYGLRGFSSYGRSEADFLNFFSVVSGETLREELESRELLLKKERLRLEDISGRALGLLSNARVLPYPEFMQNISYLKLGLETGCLAEIPGLNPAALAFSCGKYGLIFSGRSFDKKKNADIERAVRVRKILLVSPV